MPPYLYGVSFEAELLAGVPRFSAGESLPPFTLDSTDWSQIWDTEEADLKNLGPI
jgi:hypothetical protein